VAEPSGSPPGPAHASRQAGEDSPRQRSNRRACCLRDYLQLVRAKDQTRLRVNLAQISTVVRAIHCRMQVPRIERVSSIPRIWCIIGRQTSIVNSGVSGPKFTKFLNDVDRTSALLTRPSAFPSCHPSWNASPKKEGVADFAPKIGCHGNVPWPIWKPIPDWTSTPICLPTLKIWWRSVL